MTNTIYNGVETSTELKIMNNFSEYKCHAWITKSFNSNMQLLTITVHYKSFAQ
jgi:hypothetical protein